VIEAARRWRRRWREDEVKVDRKWRLRWSGGADEAGPKVEVEVKVEVKAERK
jgi:hypothetical protein